MTTSRLRAAVLLSVLGMLPALGGQDTASVPLSRIQLTLNAGEAEAALGILDKRVQGAPITDADWQRLFVTEPYTRLKKREASMHRDFTDDDFKTFVLISGARREGSRVAPHPRRLEADGCRRFGPSRADVSARTGGHQGQNFSRHQAQAQQL